MPAMPCCLCLSAHPQMGDSGRNEATGAAWPAAAPQASNYPFSGIRGYNGREEEAATAPASAGGNNNARHGNTACNMACTHAVKRKRKEVL